MCALRACGEEPADIKTLGTIPHAGVHARIPRQKILLLSMALTCGGLPTQRSFRLAALSFLLSFCYRFGAWCNLDFFKDSALKNGRWFTLCLSSRDCSFGGPGDTPCCSLCEDISLKPQIEIHAKGFPQQSSGVIVFFPPYRFTVVCRCSKKNGHANTNSLGGGFL